MSSKLQARKETMRSQKLQSSVTNMGNKRTKDIRSVGSSSGQKHQEIKMTEKEDKCGDQNKLPMCYGCQRREWGLEDYQT